MPRPISVVILSDRRRQNLLVVSYLVILWRRCLDSLLLSPANFPCCIFVGNASCQSCLRSRVLCKSLYYTKFEVWDFGSCGQAGIVNIQIHFKQMQNTANKNKLLRIKFGLNVARGEVWGNHYTKHICHYQNKARKIIGIGCRSITSLEKGTCTYSSLRFRLLHPCDAWTAFFWQYMGCIQCIQYYVKGMLSF